MGKTMDSKDIIKKLSDMIELEYDAMAAYKAAIERLDNPAFQSKLRDFLGDHERHVRELNEVVRDAGGTPPDSGDIKQILTKGKVILADMGGDDALLKAMTMNEEQTVSAYALAVEEGYPDNIRVMLQAALDDERKHRDWMEKAAKEAS